MRTELCVSETILNSGIAILDYLKVQTALGKRFSIPRGQKFLSNLVIDIDLLEFADGFEIFPSENLDLGEYEWLEFFNHFVSSSVDDFYAEMNGIIGIFDSENKVLFVGRPGIPGVLWFQR